MITANQTKGYAKLDTFQFQTDVVDENMVIDYGDGNFEVTNETNFSHIYDNFGIYSVSIRRCNESVPFQENCLTVFVEPFVKSNIVLTNPPLSSHSSKSAAFTGCLSSNCDFPIQIRLHALGTGSPHITDHPDDYLLPCKPKHYFTDDSGNVLEDNLLTVTEGGIIYVNELACGVHSLFTFEYFDDWVGDVEICAELLEDCFECQDLSIDFSDCPLSGVYYGNAGEIDMIDVDIF